MQKKAPLGKLYEYAKVMIKSVDSERGKDLEERKMRESLQTGSRFSSGDLPMAQHPLRHHGYHHLCPPVQPASLQLDNGQDAGMDDVGRDKLRCRRRKKRKKKKRRCKEGEQEGELCQNRDMQRRKKCQQGEGQEVCEKRLEAAKRRRKSRNGVQKLRERSDKNKKKQRNGKNKTKFVSEGEIGKDFGSARARTGGLGEYDVTAQSQSQSPAASVLSPTTTPPPTTSAISVLTSTVIPAASLFSTILTGTAATSSSASVSWSTSTATTRLSTPTRAEDNLPVSSSGISTTAGTPK